MFTFTTQEVKERTEREVERWSATKRRRLSREESFCSGSSSVEMDDGELIDDEICAGTKRNISIQTQGHKQTVWLVRFWPDHYFTR